MSKRGAREGTIRERTDGRWEARYRIGDGRQRSVYGETRGEARDRLRAALAAAEGGLKPVGARLTTGAYLDEWLETSVRPRLRPTTAANYEIIIRLYLKPAIGRVPLAKLKAGHVQRMLALLGERETARGRLSPTTVRYAYTVLRIALGRALKQGLVMRNVATLVDPPAKDRREMTPLTADQVATFLASTRSDRLAALWTTAIGLGLRQGELLALRWQDVDQEAGTLSIRHSLRRVTRELAEPKTERARRTLIMPRMIRESLGEHRRRQLEERLAAGPDWHDLDHVFATSVEAPLDPRNVNRMLHAALARADLPRQRFHDMRHACATLLVEQGEDLAVVSRILGHANLATTADVYAHLTRGMQERAAERMDSVLRRSEAS